MVSIHAAICALALSGAGGQAVLLDFYADWCGPCREMNPTVEALMAAGYPVQRVNIDKNRELAQRYGVRSLPSFVMVVDGREIDRTVGKTSYARLEHLCKSGLAAAGASAPAAQAPVKPAVLLADLPAPSPPPAGDISNFRASERGGEDGRPDFRVGENGEVPFRVSDAALLAASVRLRIEDPDGRSCGSGTIIDRRGDEALVLTCGHIFRDSKGQGRITVDLFDGLGEPRSVPGRLISYNLENDVGLVAIRSNGPVTAARLAPPGYRVERGASVASVGCNNGDRPTVRHSRVNSLNKYQGPANLQVAGQPVEGRSGGGLFSSDGYVIGVCNAADPSDQEGLFAAVELVHAELDRDKLAFVYQTPSESAGSAGSVVPASFSPPPAAPAVASIAPPMPGPTGEDRPDFRGRRREATVGEDGTAPLKTAGASVSVAPASANVQMDGELRPAERAAWAELERGRSAGAEVVCIIRPRGNPDAKSEVIVLDHASTAFVEKLAAEGRPQERSCVETSLEQSKKPRVLLEWAAPNPNASAASIPAGR